MAVTTWYFVEHDHGRMVRTPVTRMDRFFDGEDALSHSSGSVRAVEATVSVVGRQIQQVHRVLWLRLAVDDDGRCDQRSRAEYARLAIEHTRLIDHDAPVVPLSPSIAGLRMKQDHGWQPSEGHLELISKALNGKAVRPPVVAIDGNALRLL